MTHPAADARTMPSDGHVAVRRPDAPSIPTAGRAVPTALDELVDAVAFVEDRTQLLEHRLDQGGLLAAYPPPAIPTDPTPAGPVPLANRLDELVRRLRAIGGSLDHIATDQLGV